MSFSTRAAAPQRHEIPHSPKSIGLQADIRMDMMENRMPRRTSKPVTADDRLRRAGIVFDRLEDLPAEVVREGMRHCGIPNMRSIELAGETIRRSLNEPLLGDLLVTRVGFHGPAAGHYIPRPQGSLDHIVIHNVAGEGWLEIAGKRWKVEPNSVVCIPPGVPHAYGAATVDPWSVYWLHLTGNCAGHYYRLLGVSSEQYLFHLPHGSEILSAFEGVWAAMNVVHTWENLVQASIRAAHYIGLVRQFQRARDPRLHATEEAVRRSIAFMQNNLGAESSLMELAELAGLSVTSYTTAFRKLTDCSPVEYFNRLKMQKACELLRFSKESVAQIANELGYPDPYYFSHAFKKSTGLSPVNFRKR
jgi:AraC family transcriptional regulator, arabinose operon regulatory protein